MNAPPPSEAVQEVPWYRATGPEKTVFEHCFANKLPLMLRGPTGSGKSRFVEHMAATLGRPLVTVAAHDDTSAADLVGRWIIRGGETVWQDGPVTRAVRSGAILYIDEIAEARSDVIVVLHPLGDHRRRLFVERHDEELEAADGFMLVVSWNPGYQRALRELKPSTRQRFVGLTFDYPVPAVEEEILIGETGVDPRVAKRLVALAGKIRGVDHLGLAEKPSTRLLVGTARLIGTGLPPRLACRVGIVEPLTDDVEVAGALGDLCNLVFD